jgi:integrase/recombinase XerD
MNALVTETFQPQPPPGHLSGQAETDQQVIGMWLYGKSPNTQMGYRGDIQRFFERVQQSLAQITLGTVQGYLATLSHLAAATQARVVNALKSLFSFAYRIGYLPFNVLVPVQAPKRKDTLSERILAESHLQVMVALEPNPRNRILLKLLYSAGLRVSEVCNLKWRDVQARAESNFPGQVTIFGKGQKTRTVVLSSSVWNDLMSLRGDAGIDDPVFRSRKQQGHLTPTQVRRLVKQAAQRTPILDAAIAVQVSPHWLRHAHASHALDRGAPIHLVQSTLGHASVATTGRYLHARPSDSSARFISI